MTTQLRSIRLDGDTIIMSGWLEGGGPVQRTTPLSEYNRVVRAFMNGQIAQPDDIRWRQPWEAAEWLFQHLGEEQQ